MTKPAINVAFLPIYPNPYQEQLRAGLANHGVSVQFLDSMPDPDWLENNRGRVQILHLHWLYGIYMARFKTPFTVAAFLHRVSLAQRMGYRIVWTAHNILPHRTELRPLHYAIRSTIMKRADAVIVHCDHGAKELRKRFERDRSITVIPIGNQIGRYPVSLTVHQARASLGLNEDQYVYLFLGLLVPYKGLDALLESFSRVATPKDVLVIAGESFSSSVTKQVEAAARSDGRIQLHLSYIPDEAMQRYLLSANVLVTPYREVLTSSSAVLGLSYGLPVIAPALGCLPELLSEETGILYDPSATGALDAAMQAIKQRDAVQMRSAALATAERLDWDSIGQQTADVYRECIEQSS